MTGRVKRAIDVLLDAINNRTLAKGTCTACAVGNLVAHGMGGEVINTLVDYPDDYKYIENNEHIRNKNTAWSLLFYTDGNIQHYEEDGLHDELVQQCINATEFSVDELMKIEYAFETNTKIKYFFYCNYDSKEILKDQINGLEAVVKVMLEFDDIKADVNEVFTSKVTMVDKC